MTALPLSIGGAFIGLLLSNQPLSLFALKLVTVKLLPFDNKSELQVLVDMPEFGMLFTADADLHRLTWYGEGPDESYVDRRGGARLDVHTGDVATQLTPYVRPQEAGNHTGVGPAVQVEPVQK